MKKIIATILGLICLTSVTALGCASDNEEPVHEFYTNDIQVGDELLVYPDYDFYYKVNDEMTVHITEISVTLTEINTIEQGETLEEEFYPYVFTIRATGETDAKFAGTKINLYLLQDYSSTRYYYTSNVDEFGNINWEYRQTRWNKVVQIYFNSIELST